KSGSASVEDLLLLFIYLEIGAMVSIYFKTNRLPVRFLVYVAITAITRELISIANYHDKTDAIYIMMISGGILLLTFAVLVLRFGSFRYPTDKNLAELEDDS
ncbi:MAG: phosphate-starvation-inducible PsiE family protein, partial [Devosiaceae bacterium]|nr:phosphate-starvation-inducible PsiE family protein [Devosiaceae bacterium]